MDERHEVVLDIIKLSNCLSREMATLNPSLLSEGVSDVNARIVSFLAENEDRSIYQKDLEEFFSIRRSTVSKVVALMEEKGFVRREPVPEDARLKRLVLTERAKDIYKTVSREFSAYETRITDALTAEEVTELRRLLGKIRVGGESLCSMTLVNDETVIED